MDTRKFYRLLINSIFFVFILLNFTNANQSKIKFSSNLGRVNSIQTISTVNNETVTQELLNSKCEKCICDSVASGASELRRISVHPRPIPDISDACQAILENFAVRVANFSSCIAMNARPITVCQYCISEYQEVTYWFQNISSDGGAGCNEELLNRDHLLVVQSLARDAERFWDTAHCPNCYSRDEDPPKLCNDTLGFLKLLDQVTNCINNTQNNQSEVCLECRDDYLKLNDYYENLNTIYNNRLCMDVMDGMNITRHMWSSTYQCTSIEVEGMAVLLTSLGFLLLPILYYCANRLVANVKDTRLVQPKRMSFVHASYSSASLQR